MPKDMNDYKLTADNELDTSSGDFVTVESTYQHQRAIIESGKGDYKENPAKCVGIDTYRDDENAGGIVREIAVEFVKDGMEVDNMQANREALLNNEAKVFNNAYYV